MYRQTALLGTSTPSLLMGFLPLPPSSSPFQSMCTPSLDHFHFLIWKDYENCTGNSQEQNPPMKKTCCLTPKSCRQQFNWPCASCALAGLGIRKELSVGGATHRNRVNAFWLFFPLFFSFLLSFPFLPPFLPAYLQFFSLSLFSAKKIRKRDS